MLERGAAFKCVGSFAFGSVGIVSSCVGSAFLGFHIWIEGQCLWSVIVIRIIGPPNSQQFLCLPSQLPSLDPNQPQWFQVLDFSVDIIATVGHLGPPGIWWYTYGNLYFCFSAFDVIPLYVCTYTSVCLNIYFCMPWVPGARYPVQGIPHFDILWLIPAADLAPDFLPEVLPAVESIPRNAWRAILSIPWLTRWSNFIRWFLYVYI